MYCQALLRRWLRAKSKFDSTTNKLARIFGKFLYFYPMKPIVLLLALGSSLMLQAQFSIDIKTSKGFLPSEVYLYTLDGSKDVLVGKSEKKNDRFSFSYPNSYVGMMKAYFPQANYSVSFASENKPVQMSVAQKEPRSLSVFFEDPVNQAMEQVRNWDRKRESILPVLGQIKEFYNPSEPFYQALEKEQQTLISGKHEVQGFPFVEYYANNSALYAGETPSPNVTQQQVVQFLTSTSDYLETSSLLRPILVNYLRQVGTTNAKPAVDALLNSVNVESPRGQTILSELIEIFDMYGMPDLKESYLSFAQNLKCTLNQRLAGTIEVNQKTSVGAKFDDYVFQGPTRTSAKSIYGVNAQKKVIVFWSSTCKHCETDLPKFIPYYSQMKAQGIEIIGLSLDTDRAQYKAKADVYPWINDTELRGWYSSFADTYNVRATPFYFVLDAQNKILAKPDYATDVVEFLGLK